MLSNEEEKPRVYTWKLCKKNNKFGPFSTVIIIVKDQSKSIYMINFYTTNT